MSGMMTGQPVPPKTSARDNEERRMMQMMEQIQQHISLLLTGTIRQEIFSYPLIILLLHLLFPVI